MKTRTIVLIIVGAVGLLLLAVGAVVGVGAYAVYQTGKAPPAIVMSNANPQAMRARDYVDATLHFRIRYPKNFSVERTSINGRAGADAKGNPGLLRVWSTPQPSGNFYMLARGAMAGVKNQLVKDGGSDPKTVAYNSTTIDGKNAIVAELTWRHASELLHSYIVIIDDPTGTWYMIMAACPETEWPRLSVSFETAIASFRSGAGGLAQTDMGDFNRGDVPVRVGPRVVRPEIPAVAPRVENVKPKTKSTEEMLADLGANDVGTVSTALHHFLQIEPDATKRKDVVAGLVKVLERQDAGLHMTAGMALAKWVDRNTVTLVLPYVKSPERPVRDAAIRGLSNVKDPRAAAAIAGQLGGGSHEARDALRKMGNIAEDAVIDVLKNGELKAQCDAAKVLADIGTKDAVEPLRDASKSAEFFLRVDADRSLKKLEARLSKVVE